MRGSGDAAPPRYRKYATGRLCVRTAFTRLGLPVVPVGRGPSGEPQWPQRLVRSITHCDGYRAAAVARRAEVAGIGIDAEPHIPLPSEVLPQVVDAEEQALCRN